MAEDEKTKKAPQTTTFFIFEQQSDKLLWQLVGSVEASGRDQAARVFYGDSDREVTFAAVTMAAWQPRRRTIAVKHAVKLEEVDVAGATGPSPAGGRTEPVASSAREGELLPLQEPVA